MKTIHAVGLLMLFCCPVMARDTMTTVSMTLWGEARNQSYAGKYAVASVIYNRAGGSPAKMEKVCLSRKQFSCWRKGRFIQALPDLHKPMERKAWTDCVTLASLLTEGKFKPNTPAKSYHEKSIRPYWASSKPMLCMTGDHIFYR